MKPSTIKISTINFTYKNRLSPEIDIKCPIYKDTFKSETMPKFFKNVKRMKKQKTKKNKKYETPLK